jgi:hypothetical protein
VLAAMLSDDPADRPSAHEVARRWRGEQPVPVVAASRPALPPRPRRRRRRLRPAAVAAAAVTALVLTAGGAAAGTALLSEPEVPPLPAPAVPGPTGDALRDLHEAVSQ